MAFRYGVLRIEKDKSKDTEKVVLICKVGSEIQRSQLSHLLIVKLANFYLYPVKSPFS